MEKSKFISSHLSEFTFTLIPRAINMLTVCYRWVLIIPDAKYHSMSTKLNINVIIGINLLPPNCIRWKGYKHRNLKPNQYCRKYQQPSEFSYPSPDTTISQELYEL